MFFHFYQKFLPKEFFFLCLKLFLQPRLIFHQNYKLQRCDSQFFLFFLYLKNTLICKLLQQVLKFVKNLLKCQYHKNYFY